SRRSRAAARACAGRASTGGGALRHPELARPSRRCVRRAATGMKALLKALGALPFRLMPTRVVQRVISLVLYAASRRHPAAAVRALLDIERVLSGYIDEAGMRYEGGIHPKHRLTRYHDFFVDRVKAGERVLDIG